MPILQKILAFVLLAILKRLPSGWIYPLARMYIAGNTKEEAITLAQRLWEQHGVKSTIDVLGEEPRTWDEVTAAIAEYRTLVLACSGLGDYVYLSAKLTAFGQRLDEQVCYEQARDLVSLASSHGLFVRWDMEDHTTTSSTLRIFQGIRGGGGFTNTGVVLQSRLHMTWTDLEQLMKLHGASIRLCIGIYREPAGVALTNKREMKDRLLEQLEAGWKAGLDIRVASHDPRVVRAALALARRLKKPMSEVEIQWLYGVPHYGLREEILQAGAGFRYYIPYGVNWRPYCFRRLGNNPELVWYIVKNFFGWISSSLRARRA